MRKSLFAVLGGIALSASAMGFVPAAQAQEDESQSDNQPAANAEGQTDESFYDTDGLDLNKPGEILKQQDAPYANQLGRRKSNLPTTATKIMYTTTDANGDLVPVTGYTVEPTVPWRGEGARPTVVIGRGTVGQGDHCAPSRTWPLDGQPDAYTTGPSGSTEGLYDYAFSRYGVRVVVTDLIGLGTPGVHTYMNRLDQAHAMLDAARAVDNLVGAENSGKIGFYGHSQGGGSSAAAIEEAANYYTAEEQARVAGAYASAPPADPFQVMGTIDGSILSGAIGFAINGMAERYDDFDGLLDKYLSEEGQGILEDLSEECTDDITDEPYAYMSTDEWTKDGRSLTEILQEPDMAPAMRRMEEQKIGKGTPIAPVMIISGRYDRIVAYEQARDLAKKWCTDGAKVVYRDDILPEIGDGTPNHGQQSESGAVFGIPFMIGRFNDAPLRDSTVCSNFEGNQGSSAIDAGSSLSSLPLSSELVPPFAPATGSSSGVQGSSSFRR